jgi:histidinol-phosphate aminotransferase
VTRPPLEVRPDLAEVAPYFSPQRSVRYRMNVNESPYPPPPKVVEAVRRAVSDRSLNRYPDRDATELHRLLARLTGWSADGLWIANGSNEVIQHLFLAFGGPERTVMTFEPTYSLHSLIPRITGTRLRSLWRDEDFVISLDDALAEIERGSPEIVMVCSPNNPSGNCEPLTTVRALLEETRGLVVVDEAYGEFASPDESVRPLLDEHRNLVLVKTFSKGWCLAGARIGYMMGDPSLVEELQRVRLPYHLSSLTQAAGAASMRHADELLKAVDAIVSERDRISVELQAMGIKIFPSRANFVLFEVDDPGDTFNRLLEHEVLVRNYDATPGLRGCLRVTAGLPEETDAFLTAMGKILG